MRRGFKSQTQRSMVGEGRVLEETVVYYPEVLQLNLIHKLLLSSFSISLDARYSLKVPKAIFRKKRSITVVVVLDWWF